MRIQLYLVSIPLFIALDMLWLTLVAKNFYAQHLGHLMAPSINWISALLFYLIYTAGLTEFVVYPAWLNDSPFNAFFYGSFFGLVTYATYDLTNLATIANWPVVLTVVDLVWGAFLGGTVSLMTYRIAKLYMSW